MPGFPIRTPWDHSLVDSSPRPIAASHVLHRLLVPRHPPFALDNLTTKMLASTVQFSTNDQPTTPTANTKPPTKPAGMLTRLRLEKKQPHLLRGIRHQEQPGCSLRTQQGAHHYWSAAPNPRSTEDFHPQAGSSCTRIAGRCQLITRQCLRH